MLSDSPYGGRKLKNLKGQSVNDAWLQSWPSSFAFFQGSILSLGTDIFQPASSRNVLFFFLGTNLLNSALRLSWTDFGFWDMPHVVLWFTAQVPESYSGLISHSEWWATVWFTAQDSRGADIERKIANCGLLLAILNKNAILT